ncbi:UDP-N-acetylmuramate--L-alanine ligase [Humibacter ginsenosidimutans]|uniref:UDP-N-acetylmuramate--L-alanine ligase n=1 Tax=Humibacter ginsenosidimutans TaxID=2599293 RepID=A0A5B8LYT8_9MICO|nr:UDP-N-acetylmuramate--L-alanine ligase [Humibacter ginsenosidimutans]QDZ13678.1 UDP-N-acetylmuramate--L-alanine ligase [Humibacter ginsenosidimutans]
MIKPDLTMTLPDTIGRAHFVGIGGSGMSGIARLFLQAGVLVTGSDRVENGYTQALRELGAEIHIGHEASNVGDADTLVVTGALWQDNPEYQYALAHDIPVLHRSQALAWLTRGERLVAVAGAHGKSGTTGMLATALVELGADPSFVNGAVIEGLETNARRGESDLFVIEADESDGSFLLYDTAVALILNIDDDHLDHYGSYDAVEDAFVTFADKARELVVISADDNGARAVLPRISHQHVVTFGQSETADVRVTGISTVGPVGFTLRWRGREFPVQLTLPGRHHAHNAAGAFAVLVHLGIDPDRAAVALQSYGGTHRRFELHGTVGGVSVYDDYAHHPAEVRAVLEAARSVVGDGRIIAVHQPHTYSRTQRLAKEFADTLESYADETVVLDVFGAREDPVPGVTGALVSESFHDASKVAFIADWQEASDYTAKIARDGDFVITLGCGDVYRIVPQLLESLRRADG